MPNLDSAHARLSPARPASASAEAVAAAMPTPPWLPDRGDGTYQNPVLFADYSDPDAIRVGGDYWMTASSFNHVPGLPILHSRDLVNWTLVGHALARLVPEEHFRQPRHGAGVWAPALRYHNGRYWIFYPDPDHGLYAITAENPREPWSSPVLVRGGRGLIDPCPFWDDDGRAYLVHGWAKSRSGVSNRITLHRMDPESGMVLDEGVVIIDGDRLPGWHTIEGPKLYKRSGYYYVFAPAGGVATGYQAIFRSKQLAGPYEHHISLRQGNTPINGPHQGAWVDTPTGEHWFLHFQERPAYGRIVHLQPMRWVDDWPVMGTAAPASLTGEPVLVHAKPAGARGLVTAPATSDFFNHHVLGAQWQWQANPDPSWASLTATPGRLRLQCVPHPVNATLWTAPHLLMQKFPAPAFVATTHLHLVDATAGSTAGLIVFGYSYAWLGLRRDERGTRLVFTRCADAHRGGAEVELWSQETADDAATLEVRVTERAQCEFAVIGATGERTPLAPRFTATSSTWVGAKVGLFARRPDGGDSGSAALVDYFRVTAKSRSAES